MRRPSFIQGVVVAAVLGFFASAVFATLNRVLALAICRGMPPLAERVIAMSAS